MEFTHLDEHGSAVMVDVSGKQESDRSATATGCIQMTQECFEAVRQEKVKKGNVLGTARIAGIMALKNTSALIPLCHPLAITGAAVEFKLCPESNTIEARCTAKTTGQTGVEMEALTGVSVTLLTIYDMCKALDKSMEIKDIMLVTKTGGKSGSYYNEKQMERTK